MACCSSKCNKLEIFSMQQKNLSFYLNFFLIKLQTARPKEPYPHSVTSWHNPLQTIILTKSCDCKVTGKNLATQLNHAQVDTLWLMSKHQVNIWIIFWWKIIDPYTDDPIDPYTGQKPKYNSKYNNPILLFIFLSRHWIKSSPHPPPLCWLLSCLGTDWNPLLILLIVKLLSCLGTDCQAAQISTPAASCFNSPPPTWETHQPK